MAEVKGLTGLRNPVTVSEHALLIDPEKAIESAQQQLPRMGSCSFRTWSASSAGASQRGFSGRRPVWCSALPECPAGCHCQHNRSLRNGPPGVEQGPGARTAIACAPEPTAEETIKILRGTSPIST